MKQIRWVKGRSVNRIGDVSLCLLRINVDLFKCLILVNIQYFSSHDDEEINICFSVICFFIILMAFVYL